MMKSKKRVGINAIVLNPQSGGLGVYLINLIDYLVHEDVGFEPVIFLSSQYKVPPNWLQSGLIRTLSVSSEQPINRILIEAFLWPKVIREHRIDLFHSPMSYIPFGVKVPAMVTIHDLRSFHDPKAYTWLRRQFLERMIGRSAEKALRILTISEFTKQDIIKTLGIAANRIRVIYEGLDRARFQKSYAVEERMALHRKYNLPAQYILTVGHLEPRKNYPRLLQAFHILRQRENIEHGLVIVGRENWAFGDIYDTVERLKLSDAVRFTHFVDDKDLPALYQMADVFVAPSLFEGFGFTPLESMAAGTPVAAANAASLPEVCGNAAWYFDPHNTEEMAHAILGLISDRQKPKEWVRRGYENVKRFDWKHSGHQTVKEYENLLAQL